MVARPQQVARRRAKEKAQDLAAELLDLEAALNLRASGESAERAEVQSRGATKSVPVTEAASSRLAEQTVEEVSVDQPDCKAADFKQDLEFVASLSLRLPPGVDAGGEAVWNQAVESLARSAGVMEELAESTGEAVARIAARGDRIDRVQKETRASLDALVAPEANS
jgi:hypothetical protein